MILFFNTILGTVNKKWLVQIILNLGSWNELQDKPSKTEIANRLCNLALSSLRISTEGSLFQKVTLILYLYIMND